MRVRKGLIALLAIVLIFAAIVLFFDSKVRELSLRERELSSKLEAVSKNFEMASAKVSDLESQVPKTLQEQERLFNERLSQTLDGLYQRKNHNGFTEAKKRFVYITTKSVFKKTGKSEYIVVAGTRVSSHYILTCHHAIKDGCDEYEIKFGKNILSVSKVNLAHDLMLLEFKDGDYIPKVKIAKEVNFDEEIVNVSSVWGETGFWKRYRVSCFDKFGFILSDLRAIPGESGLGLFNENGELVATITVNVPSFYGNGDFTLFSKCILLEKVKPVFDVASVISHDK